MDIEQIKALIELMSDNALTEIMIRDGESRILLRRGPRTISVPESQAFHFANPGLNTAAPSAGAAIPPAAESPRLEIKAPMVGTFYNSPDPESPPFVKVGASVTPDTVVCIIEAMKVFNEIKAEVSGVIERVVAENGGPVEFGQCLFHVRPH